MRRTPGGGGGSETQGTKTEVAHKWAWWLQNPCQLGAPTASKRETNESGPQVGLVAT